MGVRSLSCMRCVCACACVLIDADATVSLFVLGSLSASRVRRVMFLLRSRALCLVTWVLLQTGMHTELGRIQKNVEEADTHEDTPLQKKIGQFGNQLQVLVYTARTAHTA